MGALSPLRSRLPELNMGLFSFNKPGGACPTCTGLGTVYTPDLKRVLDEEKSIQDGAVLGWDKVHLVPYHTTTLRRAAQHYGFPFDPAQPVRELVPRGTRPAALRYRRLAISTPLSGGGAAGDGDQGPLRGGGHRPAAPSC